MKIFYHPKTLKIMGGSDGENTMDFPYVETDENYHAFGNLAIIIEDNLPKLIVVNGYWEDSVYNK